MNNRGQLGMIIGLLFLFMVIVVAISLLPALKAILNIAQQSNNLNCVDYKQNGDPNNVLSYNSSLATDTLSCMAIKLYIPYLLLVVLVGGITKLLYGRATDQSSQQYGGM